MSKRLFVVFSILIAASMILTACGGQKTVINEITVHQQPVTPNICSSGIYSQTPQRDCIRIEFTQSEGTIYLHTYWEPAAETGQTAPKIRVNIAGSFDENVQPNSVQVIPIVGEQLSEPKVWVNNVLWRQIARSGDNFAFTAP